ncbi:MFS transporter [Cognatilysobacter bugurensis]|uniref:MFS transporter n=1 Tax=Cognatilysobacter bugurensis TaxID=543356 RepID=A0A918T177_9GAMM|nr:MFS transporter [Lysobacter bugurensis]GHA84598.1 MFS transporter [Lysobacter bugurensis]
MRLAVTQDVITSEDLEHGSRRLMFDAAFATIVGTLNSGVVLVAYALMLGASSTVIGILAAIPFLTQLLQAPAVLLIERIRSRRLVSIIALFAARLALPLMAVLGFIESKTLALTLLVVAETVHCAFNAVGACGWNSWIRDLIPEERMGAFFARRTIWATMLGIVGTGLAAGALHFADPVGGGGSPMAFAILYLIGFVSSLFSTWQLAKVPEPSMPAPVPGRRLRNLFAQPFKDKDFVSLMRFFASWNFAVNLAAPFFTVFMIKQLGYSAGFVLMMSIVSQLANIVVLRVWGQLSDRFTNKTVLTFASPAFIACIAAMALAGEIGDRAWTTAYLTVLHVLMGMTSAGVALASSAIGLKLAPRGAASAYLATNALITSLAAGIAPLLGGSVAAFFERRQLSLNLEWRAPDGTLELIGLSIGWWQFFFLGSALLGLYSLHRLSLVREEGEVPRREMVQHVLNVARRGVRNASTVAGLRAAVAFPGGRIIQERRQVRTRAEGDDRREQRSERRSGDRREHDGDRREPRAA